MNYQPRPWRVVIEDGDAYLEAADGSQISGTWPNGPAVEPMRLLAAIANRYPHASVDAVIDEAMHELLRLAPNDPATRH